MRDSSHTIILLLEQTVEERDGGGDVAHVGHQLLRVSDYSIYEGAFRYEVAEDEGEEPVVPALGGILPDISTNASSEHEVGLYSDGMIARAVSAIHESGYSEPVVVVVDTDGVAREREVVDEEDEENKEEEPSGDDRYDGWDSDGSGHDIFDRYPSYQDRERARADYYGDEY